MDEIGVVYYGYVFDASGYGHAARGYLHALRSAGVELSVVDLAHRPPQVRDELVESLAGRRIDADFHLFHGIPPQWARLAFRLKNAIGMTVWETDVMPSQWRSILNHVLEVWLPCEFNVSTFKRSLATPIFKLPHALFPSPANGDGDHSAANRFLGVDDSDFVFYSIFEWQDRKSPSGLIEAFLRAFAADRDAVLVVKANPGAAGLAARALEDLRRHTNSSARVELRCEAWSDEQLGAALRRGDCYVSLHRGEGWCYPLFEAAARGTPVIATAFSGPMEYLDQQSHRLIEYKVEPVRQPYIYYHPSMRWAAPDLARAASEMRWVYCNRDLARAQASAAATRLQSAYSPEAVGAQARERLLELLKRTRPHKWERIERRERASRHSPSAPISPDWYDEDYFETGVKSNWTEGYTWPLFSGLFTETASFLTGIFRDAESFLDIGCAKGFLVRTLREQGKDCWGFDASRWAIEHAEGCVRTFVTLGGVDDVEYDRQFDVLLAFETFEHLTESQTRAFLTRARAWTRQAMFATIPSFDTEEEERLYRSDDEDLSHITMRSREWWKQLFAETGWRQDPLHRIVERTCQTHELPSRMGWKVYVYSPV